MILVFNVAALFREAVGGFPSLVRCSRICLVRIIIIIIHLWCNCWTANSEPRGRCQLDRITHGRTGSFVHRFAIWVGLCQQQQSQSHYVEAFRECRKASRATAADKLLLTDRRASQWKHKWNARLIHAVRGSYFHSFILFFFIYFFSRKGCRELNNHSEEGWDVCSRHWKPEHPFTLSLLCTITRRWFSFFAAPTLLSSIVTCLGAQRHNSCIIPIIHHQKARERKTWKPTGWLQSVSRRCRETLASTNQGATQTTQAHEECAESAMTFWI